MVRQEAIRRGLIPPDCASSFSEFLESTKQADWRYDWPHLVYLQEILNSFAAGDIQRLMVFMPPRHTKSETLTIRYAAWRLVAAPRTRIIVGAYNQELANKFSRSIRRIVKRFANLAEDQSGVQSWETPQQGGLRAVGVGAGVTGHGGHVVLIDDPVKSREEASSEVYREKVWNWYTDDLYTRLEPGAQIALVMTRWHEDDLAGRILASDDAHKWTVISLPALAEDNDPLGRLPGQALCPDRYDEKQLAEIRSVIGEYGWSALYQQRPAPREGSFFKPALIEIVDALPAGMQMVRAWDMAATQDDGDYTVGLKMGRHGDRFFICDVVRGQWDPSYRDKQIRQTAELDGVQVRVRGPQDPGAAGKESAKAFIRNLAGFPVQAKPVSGDKVTRADPFASQVNAGNVSMLKGPWNRALLDELGGFPVGKHDDQVDAGADAFAELSARQEFNIYIGNPQNLAKEESDLSDG